MASRLLYVDGMRRTLGLLVSLVVAAVPAVASAHARFVDPTPRYDPPANPGGIKEAQKPCGMAKPATAAHTYTMGSTITVKINEVIDHPGHYELWWSNANDTAFAVIPGMNNIPNPVGKADATVQLTLPATAMDNATLQLIMVMTENPAAPTNYYSCADIKLAPVGADLAGMMPADLSIPPTADLSEFNNFDDLSGAASDDAGAPAGPDMAKRPGAEGSGVPGCSIGGPRSGALALGGLLVLLFGLALVPQLLRHRKR